jgi:pimeloyl-ACP methyl ester carboxylesterase
MEIRLLALAAVLTLSAAASAQAIETNASPPAEGLRAAPCAASGLPEDTRCGTLDVPEDWQNPAGRRIALNVAVVPGRAPRTSAPTFLLAGGPGQGAVELAPAVLADLRSVDPRGDLVFIDQRGTGGSNPLRCPAGFQLLEAGKAELVRDCLARLGAQASLAHYRTQDAVRDLEFARSALGYDRLNLVAASYGTRLAWAYMRVHPGRVRGAILRAAAPPDFNIVRDGLLNADAELERTIASCAANAACGADYPGLHAQLETVQRRLAQAPERVSAPDGSDILVSPELFENTLYGMMLSTGGRAQIPFAISTAAETGFQPLAPILKLVRDQLYGTLPVGMYLSIICAEDVPRTSRAELPVRTFGLVTEASTVFEVCAAWPAGHVETGFFAPVREPIPTLIVSGEFDPSTNAAAGEQLHNMLPRSRHIVVPATAHAPLLPDCVRPLARRLLESGRLPGGAADCSAVTMPPFMRRPRGTR